MSQFDHFFEKKLNEEQAFSGQQRSWAQINQELHAFELGHGKAMKSLAIWKAVAIFACLLSIALVVERQRLLQSNTQLQGAVFQAENAAKARIPENKPNIDQQQANIAGYNKLVITPDNFSSPLTAATQGPSSTLKSKKQQLLVAPTDVSSPQTASNNPYMPDQQELKNTPLPYPGEMPPSVPGHAPVASEQTATGSNLPAVTASPIDSVSKSHAPMNDAKENAFANTLTDSVSTLPTIAKEASMTIDPVKSKATRWKAGVRLHAGMAQPRTTGVSMMKGQGLGVSYRVWRNISLTAAADFIHFKVNADAIPRHCLDVKLPPTGPGPGPHGHELKNVFSEREIQQYSLGLGYALPLSGRWGVSMNMAHIWAFFPTKRVSFMFEDNNPHGGHSETEFEILDTPDHWTSNLWQVGAGVQYDTKNWTFAIKGSYYKQFQSTAASCDAAMATAELMYKF